jgi:hypothetical protein
MSACLMLAGCEPELFTVSPVTEEASEDALRFEKEYEDLNGKTDDSGNEYLNVDIRSSNTVVYLKDEAEFENFISGGSGILFCSSRENAWGRLAVPQLLNFGYEYDVPLYYFPSEEEPNILFVRNGEIFTGINLSSHEFLQEETRDVIAFYRLVEDSCEMWLMSEYDGVDEETVGD